MNILITGASGLIGSHLAPALTAQGHRVHRLHRARSAEAGQPEPPWWDLATGRWELGPAQPLEAVIHLAGENIAGRWTAAKKERIRQSRVGSTRFLSAHLAELKPRPRILLCASAVGFYGSHGAGWLDESSAAGTGFLAEVCREWEAAAQPAVAAGIRVVWLRLGVVLSAAGGALARMLPVFRWGLAGRVGSGGQYWSWIAMDDLVAAVAHVLSREDLAGPVNAVAPHPVTNLQFTRILAAVLRRPAPLPVPAWAVKLVFGEMGESTLLAGARVRPARLEQSGFVFRFGELEPALRHLLGR